MTSTASHSAKRLLVAEIYEQPIVKTKSGARRVDSKQLKLPLFQRGVYVYCTKYSHQRLMPWYVGKAVDQSFGGRLRQGDSKIKQSEIIQELAWQNHKHPVLVVIFIDGTSLSKDEIEGLESFVIKDAKRVNPLLLNVKKCSDMHRGITHTGFGIIGFDTGEFKSPKNRGTVRQKTDGGMLCRTLRHGR